MNDFWNQRFAEAEFAYGDAPHVSVCEQFCTPGSGRVLCLAEGQGRNAVYLAGLGYDVTALDFSEVGLQRAQELAARTGVVIQTLQVDLSTYMFEPEASPFLATCPRPCALGSMANSTERSSPADGFNLWATTPSNSSTAPAVRKN